MKWYHWIGIGLLGLAVILIWILTGGRGPNPSEKLGREIDAINAGAEADKVKAELGAEQAIAHVNEEYQADLAAMDEAKRERAKKLERDPSALAKFIVRGKT